jgi:osmotically inducible lipoprotein OsmB
MSIALAPSYPVTLASPSRRVAKMTKRTISAIVGLGLLGATLTACSTLVGAGVGAGAGAAVGAGTGYGAGKGALIGTGVGAAAGTIYGAVKK